MRKLPYALALLALLWVPVASRAQCQIAPSNSNPSVYRPPPPRQIFPIDTVDNGFIDRFGKRVRKPIVAEREPQPLVPFPSEDKRSCGFRDKFGAEKVKPQFRGMRPFKNGMAAVQDTNGSWGFVDESGNLAVPPKYDFVGDFSEGRAQVSPPGGDRCGYIDKEGKPALSGGFAACGQFTEGIAKVELTRGQWAFIDKSGKPLAKLSGDRRLTYVSDGLIPAESPDGKRIGLVNEKGDMVVAPKFLDVQTFSEGLAAASVEPGKWGYIDKSGKFVIEPLFCDLENDGQGRFQEGLAYVCDPKTHLFGFIDRQGKFAIPPRFTSAPCPDTYANCGFSGGLAQVESAQRRGYVNVRGHWVWSVAKESPQWAKPYSRR